jgi:Tol biopolymer transport system component
VSPSTWLQDPRWSPDGQSIAYLSDAAAPPDVWVVPAVGGEARRLTTDPTLEFDQDWSPDGARILYAANRRGSFDLLAMAVAGGPPDTIQAGAANEFGRWTRMGCVVMQSEGEKTTIWVRALDGGTPTPLTTEGRENLVAVSPDGNEVLYTSNRTGKGDVWVVPIDGGTPSQLTREVRDDWAPRYPPDGRWVAYISEAGGQQDLWVVASSGGQPIRVTNDAGTEVDLTWTGDGTGLTFSYTEAVQQIFFQPADSGTARQLTAGSKPLGPPGVARRPVGRLHLQPGRERGHLDHRHRRRGAAAPHHQRGT